MQDPRMKVPMLQQLTRWFRYYAYNEFLETKTFIHIMVLA
jgi:hypothetical protein